MKATNKENFMAIIDTLMTIEDLAHYLKVTRRTIYEWLKQNKIPAVKLIGQWRFQKDKIDTWIENQYKLNTSKGDRYAS
jgi:excisionase family DNA binding protein